ncbi:hypothetical protein Mgra_00010050 [Meloidogyne graminicola]|uniref:Uncharacterized protein n=1 Tax=Meloidogyne graminicola TaxID=189291 RepID=A0A8S9ZBG0_9BILA|nr:hypothetical protein Mgra_00010050 [Meloidogyne graminicola]
MFGNVLICLFQCLLLLLLF